MDWISWVVLGCAIGFPVGFVVWVISRLIRARWTDLQRDLAHARELVQLTDKTRAAADDVIDGLEQQLAEARARQGHELEQSLATAERRADEYRQLIEVVQRERNKWQDLYFGMAAGNDTAQQMLMRELERVTLLFQQETGKPLPITPSAKAVRSAYLEAHGGAADEYRKDQGEARKAEKAEEEAREVKRIEQAPPE